MKGTWYTRKNYLVSQVFHHRNESGSFSKVSPDLLCTHNDFHPPMVAVVTGFHCALLRFLLIVIVIVIVFGIVIAIVNVNAYPESSKAATVRVSGLASTSP